MFWLQFLVNSFIFVCMHKFGDIHLVINTVSRYIAYRLLCSDISFIKHALYTWLIKCIERQILQFGQTRNTMNFKKCSMSAYLLFLTWTEKPQNLPQILLRILLLLISVKTRIRWSICLPIQFCGKLGEYPVWYGVA